MLQQLLFVSACLPAWGPNMHVVGTTPRVCHLRIAEALFAYIKLIARETSLSFFTHKGEFNEQWLSRYTLNFGM